MLILPSILHLLPERHAFPGVIYPKFTVATQTSQTPVWEIATFTISMKP